MKTLNTDLNNDLMFPLFTAKYLGSFNPVMSVSFAQMELDRSADPPPAIWVSTTKSSVNKWVSTRDASERSRLGCPHNSSQIHCGWRLVRVATCNAI